MKTSSKKILGWILSILLLLIFSCGEDTGLGASVDTEAPKISITYPPSLAVIKDSFVFGGTWSDDKSVSSVTVDVYLLNSDDTKTVVDTQLADISSEGTWSITLNNYDADKYSAYNGWQYCDGSYEIQVTATDSAGHSSGISSRSFSIDNTAPLLVLTKPTSIGSNTPQSYGRTVQLNGTFSEACSSGISSLVVSFYDSEGSKLFDSTFSNIIDMSNANPLTIAQYYDSDEEPTSSSNNYQKWSNYSSLYTLDKISIYRNDGTNEDVQIYFSVTASDAAKIYQDFENKTEVSGGNVTSKFYMNTSDMEKLCNGKLIDNFTTASLRSYLNGTDTTYSGNETIASCLASAIVYSVTTETTESISDCISNTDASEGKIYPTLTLNPANNPKYNVSSYEIDTDTDDTDNYTESSGYYYRNYYSGSSMVVSLSTGLDGTSLSTSTISIFYTKVGSTKKQLFWTWNEAVAAAYAGGEYLSESYDSATYDSWSDYYSAWLSGIIANDNYSTWVQTITNDPSTYRYTVTISSETSTGLSKSASLSASASEIAIGSCYNFSAIGYDNDNQEIIESDSAGYGFAAISTAGAPTIKIGSKDGYVNIASQSAITDAVLADGKFGFSGTVYSDSDELEEYSESATTDTAGMYYEITLSDAEDSSSSSETTGLIKYEQDSTSADYTYKWSFTFAETDDMKNIVKNGSGLYNVNVSIYARNDNLASISRSYYLDTTAPSLSNISLTPSYVDEDNSIIYIKNDDSSTNTSFKLSGTMTDNYVIGTVIYSFTGVDSSSASKTVEISTNNGASSTSWSFTSIDLSDFAAVDSGTDITLKVTATDKAGNTTSETLNIELDNTAPGGKHRYDYKNKDLIFRVGETNNDLEELQAYDNTITALDSDLDMDVGGKYASGTWGTAQTITIRGDWIEEGSGVKMIYYKVFDSVPADSDISDFCENYATKKDGYFAPLDESITRRVSYTYYDSDTSTKTKKFTEVESTFKSTISGFSVGKNYLLLAAVDNVGNVAVDSLEASLFYDEDSEESTEWNGSCAYFSLNVDTESPILTCTSHNGTQYTNKVNSIEVSGKAEDSDSGVSSVTLKINGNSVSVEDDDLTEATDDEGETYWTWSTTIPVGYLSDLSSSKSYNVTSVVTDAAGNTSSSTIFTLQVDTVSPTVSVSKPVSSATVNGKIDVTGTVSYEDALPASLSLYYTTTEPTSSTTLSDLTQIGETITETSNIYNWSYADFNSYAVFGDDTDTITKTLYIVPVVTDTAGNCNIYSEDSSGNKTYSYTSGTNYFTYTVNRNSDRPTVKFTNLTTLDDGSYVLKYGTDATLEGTISDDDSTSSAVVSSLIITESEYSGSGTPTSTGTVTLSSDGSFTYKPSDTSDGTKNLYFYIVDNEETVFYTGCSTSYLQPYQQYKTDTATDNSSVLTYKADSTSPSVSSISVISYNSSKESNEDSTAPSTSLVLGGSEKQYAQFIITGSDENGIAGMTLTLSYTDSNDDSQTINLATSSDYSGFTEDGSTSTPTATTMTWTTTLANVDLSTFASGTVNCTVKVYDNCGLYGNSSPLFTVDNEGPVVSVTSPATGSDSTYQQNGNVTFTGTIVDSSDIDYAYYYLPSSSETDYTSSSIEWTALDSTASLSCTIDTSSLTSVCESLFATGTYTSETTGITTSYYTVPVWFKAKDELGNVGYKTFSLIYNPDVDKTGVEITSPALSDDEDSIVMGGTLKVIGTASMDGYSQSGITPYAVYLQIGSTTDGSVTSSSFGSTDKATVTGTYGYTVVDKLTILQDFYSDSTITTSSEEYTSSNIDDDFWGIKISPTGSGTAKSWTTTLNTSGEMYVENSTNTIALRAISLNSNGKMGEWSSNTILTLDDNTPSYETYLLQYSSALSTGALSAVPTTTISAERSYTSGMFVKGSNWYVRVIFSHTSGLKRVEDVIVNGTTLTSSGYAYYNDTDNAKLYVYVPVSTTETTDGSYKISATDSTERHTATATLAVNYDATAPSMYALSDATTSANPISMTKLTNSNYVVDIGGSGIDSGAGINFIAMYFKRTVDSTTTIELPISSISSSTRGTSSTVKAGTAYTSSSLTTNDEGLYGVSSSSATFTIGTSTTTITDSTISSYSFIRVGSLVKISGSYYEIESVSGTSYTISGTFSTTPSSVFYVAAIAINNQTAEVGTTSSGTTTISNDDGDGFVDYVKVSSTTGAFTWNTEIFSDELEDGEIQIVTVAVDNAGNYTQAISTSVSEMSSTTKTSTTVMLANNTPRVSKVYLATDLDGDGYFTDNELGGQSINYSDGSGVITDKFYSALASTVYNSTTSAYEGTAQAISTLTSDAEDTSVGVGLTMRDKLGLAFEFVSGKSGNNDIYYQLAVGSSALTSPTSGTFSSSSTIATNSNFLSSNSKHSTDSTSVAATLKGFEISSSTMSSSFSGKYTEWVSATDSTHVLNYIGVTLWDSTKGTTPGTGDGTATTSGSVMTYESFGSQYAVVNIPIYIDLVDDQAPTSAISDPTTTSGTGHIDLSSDLRFSPFTSSSGEFDTDTKISGTVVFSGTVTDEKRISKIKLTTSEKFNSTTVSSTTVATYDTDEDNDFSVTATPATGLTFAIDSSEFDTSSGHTVKWTLTVDSSYVANVAANDVLFTVTANDGTNSTNGTYQVDVVPYITSMTAATAVSSSGYTKRTNSIRSRLGAVPVQTSDYIVIDGYNLSTSFYRQLAANVATTTITDTITGTQITANKSYYISSPSYSGYIIAATNSVYSLNNMNGDTKSNYEQTSNTTNTYSKESDTSLDHYFDDRYVQVWQTGTNFTGSNDPNGFAVIKDSSSKMYAAWTADDAYSHTMQLGGSSTNQFGSMKDSPETMDMCVFNDKPYYVILDNWQGTSNSDPNQWSGSGLFVASDKTSYTQGTSGGSASSNTITSYSDYTLELQGNESAKSPDSSDGLDEKLNQFRNPSITACWADANKSNVRVYVSYYDYYAKCLKYGTFVFTSGTTLTTTNSMRTATNPTAGYCVVAGYDTTVTSYSNYAANVGQFSSVGVDTTTASTPIPVIAYYDTENQMLCIARGKATLPETTGAVVTTEGTTPTASYGWYTTEISSSNTTNCSSFSSALSGLALGRYVNMEVDDNGALHIVCQESESADLYYLYLTKNSDGQTYDLKILSKVDSASGVGKEGSITLGSSSSTALATYPAFSYLDSSYSGTAKGLKIAYLSSYSGTTPVWEHMTVPVSSVTSDDDSYTGIVSSCYDGGGTIKANYGIGYLSAGICTAFLRGEN
ncbi:MAG: hypothetical protein IJ630_01470 [Treponema sp.]|nr:hypothetical protein [Treponema sp.]